MRLDSQSLWIVDLRFHRGFPPDGSQEKGFQITLADFIPTTDADFGDWLSNLQAKTNATPGAYGLVAGDVAPLTAALSDWNTKYPAHLASQAQAKTDKAAKDTSRRSAITGARAIARKANGSGLRAPTN